MTKTATKGSKIPVIRSPAFTKKEDRRRAREAAAVKAQAKKDFGGTSHAAFYTTMIREAEAGRRGAPKARKRVGAISTRWRTDPLYKDEGAKRVRVKAKKESPADVRGFGLHEMLPTSETPDVMDWSAGLDSTKRTSTLEVKTDPGVQIAPLNLQDSLRVGTAFVPYRHGQAHSGMLEPPALKGMEGAHDKLREQMARTHSVVNLPQRILAAHIKATANKSQLEKEFNEGADYHGWDLAVPAEKKKFVAQQVGARDVAKGAKEWFRRNEVRTAQDSDLDESDVSEPDDDETFERVAGSKRYAEAMGHLLPRQHVPSRRAAWRK